MREPEQNRMIQTKNILILVALFLAPAAYAGAQGGGSIYSFYNLGTLETGGVGEASGRAGIEAPIRSTEGLNFGNPAGWTGLEYVAIQAGLTFEQYATSLGTETSYNNRTAIDHIAAGFPLSDSLPLVLGVGVRPYTSVGYVTGGTLEFPSADTTVSGQAIYSGSGGVSQGFAGVSVEPLDGVSFGASVEVYFGESERVSRLDFSAPGFINAGYVNRTSYSGLGATLGVQFLPVDDLVVGGSFTLPVTLTADRSIAGLYRTTAGDDTANVETSEFDIDVPATIRGGLSYRLGRTLLSGEILMQGWGGTSTATTTMRDRMRYGIGVDYTPDKSPGASGIDRWGIRAGAYYDATYIEVEGEGVTGMGLSAGISVPFARTGILGSGAAFDFGLEVGTLGNGSDQQVSELSTRISAGVRINEFWFR